MLGAADPRRGRVSTQKGNGLVRWRLCLPCGYAAVVSLLIVLASADPWRTPSPYLFEQGKPEAAKQSVVARLANGVALALTFPWNGAVLALVWLAYGLFPLPFRPYFPDTIDGVWWAYWGGGVVNAFILFIVGYGLDYRRARRRARAAGPREPQPPDLQ